MPIKPLGMNVLKVIVVLVLLTGVYLAIKPMIGKKKTETQSVEIVAKDSIPVDSSVEIIPRNVRHTPPVPTKQVAVKKPVQKQAPVKKQEIKPKKKNGERENLEIEF